MREATKARDHPVMRAGEREYPRVSQRCEVGHAGALVGDRFTVHQRHGQELPARQVKFAVSTALQRGASDRSGKRIGSEGQRAAAMDVARNLVEQQHRGAGDLWIAQELAHRAHAQRA